MQNRPDSKYGRSPRCLEFCERQWLNSNSDAIKLTKTPWSSRYHETLEITSYNILIFRMSSDFQSGAPPFVFPPTKIHNFHQNCIISIMPVYHPYSIDLRPDFVRIGRHGSRKDWRIEVRSCLERSSQLTGAGYGSMRFKVDSDFAIDL